MIILVILGGVLGYFLLGAVSCRIMGWIEQEKVSIEFAPWLLIGWPVFAVVGLVIGFIELLHWIANTG